MRFVLQNLDLILIRIVVEIKQLSVIFFLQMKVLHY